MLADVVRKDIDYSETNVEGVYIYIWMSVYLCDLHVDALYVSNVYLSYLLQQ